MASDAATLAARREALIRRSAQLRSEITADAAAVASHLRIVDTVTGFLHSGRGRLMLWGGALLMLFAGPGGVLKVAGRAAIMWSLLRRWLPSIAALRRRAHRD